ncbi:MAG TPA: lipocalin-like domain-containing protein [Steroidobacteraceae bacterium]|nr:lipocalin-like domain-containing protein [Steroidobacteraceae bacterium]
MRMVAFARWSLLSLMLTCVAPGGAMTDNGTPPPLTRRQLIGAWKLLRIEYSGPRGPAADPFYQAGSTGLIIYDSSGWMSVQITAAHRRAWQIPDARPSAGASRDAQLKAAAFDGYYAYYGTWDFDAAKSVVVHHIQSSLIPAEDGMDYAQQVALEHGRLIFTTREGKKGAESIRVKIWERVQGAAAK